jgi:hypothetical protein
MGTVAQENGIKSHDFATCPGGNSNWHTSSIRYAARTLMTSLFDVGSVTKSG